MKRVLAVILILIVGVVAEGGKGNGKVPPGQAKKESVATDPVVTEPSEGEDEEAGEVSEGKAAYILLPKAHEDLYVVGMDADNNKYGYGSTVEDMENNGYIEDIEINEKEYYGEVKVLEVQSGTSEDIKLVVGYKVPGKEQYILLSSENLDEDKLRENYQSGKGIRVINLEDYLDYAEFPGYKAEDAIMTGLRVGNEEMGKSDSPSNIIKKFGPDMTEGDGGINILPSNSHTEFYMESKDEDGNTIVYVFKKWNKDPGYYVQINNGDNLENKAATKLVITPKGGQDQYLLMGNKILTLKHNVTYTFTGDFIVNVTNEGDGSGKWYFEYISGEADVSPNSGEREVDEVYIIGSEGLYYEGKVNMKAGRGRQRESDIKIEVLSSDKNGLEIQRMSE